METQTQIKFLTIQQMAALAGVHPMSLYQRIHLLQRYGAFKFGGNGRWLMTPQDFDNFIHDSNNRP